MFISNTVSVEYFANFNFREYGHLDYFRLFFAHAMNLHKKWRGLLKCWLWYSIIKIENVHRTEQFWTLYLFQTYMNAGMEHTHVMIMLLAQTLMADIFVPVILDMKEMVLIVQVSRDNAHAMNLHKSEEVCWNIGYDWFHN